MAPLGTDDEVPERHRRLRRLLLTRRVETSRPHQTEPQTGLGHAWILIAIVIALAVAIVGWGILLGTF
jgi:hypothetical protein